jgi:peptidoglycan/xylan/chitin deacetylase (PgdA/CDA1 family)
MTSAISELVKQSLRTVGHYRRALAQAAFPGVAVLCYHGVRDDESVPGVLTLRHLHVPAATFESHCRVIRDCCDPISLDDWRAAAAGTACLPKRPVLITFDDGYRSVATRAAPILAAYDLPAAVFVCTWPMESRRLLWFDEVAAHHGPDAPEDWKDKTYADWLEECSHTPGVDGDDPRALMTPGELKTLARMKGIEIGGHTARHPILSNASAADQRREIEENLAAITEWTGQPVRAFAYPNGRPGVDYNEETLRIVHELGVDMAFTTRPMFAGPDEPALERSRFLLLDDTSDAELAHRLTYSWPR